MTFQADEINVVVLKIQILVIIRVFPFVSSELIFLLKVKEQRMHLKTKILLL